MDLVISFDTTSSMHAILDSARREMGDVLQRLFVDCGPELCVGLILHGDYGDLYETRIAQPTDNISGLITFLAEAPNTCGLDYPECYELVLHQAVTRVRWREAKTQAGGERTRLLVVLGDAVPHEPTSKRNKYKLDWRKEARDLAAIGVSVYCVDCGGVGTGFYAFARELSNICSGSVVPYRGFEELRRLLKRLLLLRGGDWCRQALEKQYMGYHNDSQGAETAPMRLPSVSSGKRATPNSKATAPSAAWLRPNTRPSDIAMELARGGGIALGKTVRYLGRLAMYTVLVYLMCTLWCATCL